MHCNVPTCTYMSAAAAAAAAAEEEEEFDKIHKKEGFNQHASMTIGSENTC